MGSYWGIELFPVAVRPDLILRVRLLSFRYSFSDLRLLGLRLAGYSPIGGLSVSLCASASMSRATSPNLPLGIGFSVLPGVLRPLRLAVLVVLLRVFEKKQKRVRRVDCRLWLDSDFGFGLGFDWFPVFTGNEPARAAVSAELP